MHRAHFTALFSVKIDCQFVPNRHITRADGPTYVEDCNDERDRRRAEQVEGRQTEGVMHARQSNPGRMTWSRGFSDQRCSVAAHRSCSRLCFRPLSRRVSTSRHRRAHMAMGPLTHSFMPRRRARRGQRGHVQSPVSRTTASVGAFRRGIPSQLKGLSRSARRSRTAPFIAPPSGRSPS